MAYWKSQKVYHILIILFLAGNSCFSQSIIEYFGIETINQIEISFTINMDIKESDNKVTKVSTDSSFIKTVEALLHELPADGRVYKDFPWDIPTWQIEILDQDNQSHHLTFYGIKLRTPETSNGSYYRDMKTGQLEKKLYLVIRNYVIGDWYTSFD